MATNTKRHEEVMATLIEAGGKSAAYEVNHIFEVRVLYRVRQGTILVVYELDKGGNPINVERITMGYPSMMEGGLLEASVTSETRTEPLPVTHVPRRLWQRKAYIFIAKSFDYDVVAKHTPRLDSMYVQYGILIQQEHRPREKVSGGTYVLPLVKFKEEFGENV